MADAAVTCFPRNIFLLLLRCAPACAMFWSVIKAITTLFEIRVKFKGMNHLKETFARNLCKVDVEGLNRELRCRIYGQDEVIHQLTQLLNREQRHRRQVL